MNQISKILLRAVLYGFVINFPLTELKAQERSVYFQRVTSDGGVLSGVPVTGPASAVKDLVKGFSASLAGGLAQSGDGNIFLADYENNRILMANKSGSFTEIVSSAAGLVNPLSITYDRTNKFLYIADSTPGSQRIVRANLNNTFPITSVEVVVNSGASESLLVTDLKYNNFDNKLYWIGLASIFRADANSQTMPLSQIETMTLQDSNLIPRNFDFDSNSSNQKVYFVNIDESTQGIYSSPVPGPGQTAFTESPLLLLNTNPDALILGLAVDSVTNTLCYSYFTSLAQKLFCGDRNNLAAASEIADNGLISAFLYLIIDESLGAVTPNTQPAAPAITVNLSAAKPQAILTFEAFSGAQTTTAALLRALKQQAKNKPKGKIGFQYYAEIKRPTDAAGAPIPKKQQDLRKLTTKKNQLAVKNLKANSNYEVKYRVEITSKVGNGDPKVVKKTPFSPTSSFTIQ